MFSNREKEKNLNKLKLAGFEILDSGQLTPLVAYAPKLTGLKLYLFIMHILVVMVLLLQHLSLSLSFGGIVESIFFHSSLYRYVFLLCNNFIHSIYMSDTSVLLGIFLKGLALTDKLPVLPPLPIKPSSSCCISHSLIVYVGFQDHKAK